MSQSHLIRPATSLLVFLLIVGHITGQDTTAQALERQDRILQLDPLIIYRSVRNTALEDNLIDAHERAILEALKMELGLTDPEVALSPLSEQEPRVPRLDQSGRWPLVAQNMVYATSIYGWMIPFVLDARDEKWYLGMEMMSLGISYYMTYKYTRNMDIPHSRAQMMRAGSAVGLRYGMGLNSILGLSDFEEDKLWALIIMASVPSGIYLGDHLYKRWSPTHGQSWSLALWSEIGAYSARQMHYILQARPKEPDDVYYWEYGGRYQYDDDTENWELVFPDTETEARYNVALAKYLEREDQYERDIKPWRKANILFEMAGYPLGALIHQRFFNDKSYSFGDAMMLYQGRVLGWMYSLMIADILDFDADTQMNRLARGLGTVGGTLIIDGFIKGRNYTPGQAILNILGTTSGLAFALGTVAIIELEEETLVQILVMSGGIVGFLLSDSIIHPRSESLGASSDPGPQLTILPGFQILGSKPGGSGIPQIIPSITMNLTF